MFGYVLLIGFAVTLSKADEICNDSPSRCDRDECCVQDYRIPGMKVCRDIGDDLGDPCGGPYFCNECDHGLVCTPVSDLLHHHYNATCQLTTNIVSWLPTLPLANATVNSKSSEPTIAFQQRSETIAKSPNVAGMTDQQKDTATEPIDDMTLATPSTTEIPPSTTEKLDEQLKSVKENEIQQNTAEDAPVSNTRKTSLRRKRQATNANVNTRNVIYVDDDSYECDDCLDDDDDLFDLDLDFD